MDGWMLIPSFESLIFLTLLICFLRTMYLFLASVNIPLFYAARVYVCTYVCVGFFSSY
ncbi:hypothetical protein C8Q69DRAFT_22335 [Paecilomyces variotii]|uniref:Uncharacterized protein n=1 Tax=Byssochlamys spectabilis TaxID=264951 RepID=A0A443I5I3_BYSSP|nr:hypothetical protein C8Q69DRAFT_22335 [Paecilomyces variotii]RWQ99353.1 hypothetical protein C8Q69DRAFT_22335 [Paecilomyces variotii]